MTVRAYVALLLVSMLCMSCAPTNQQMRDQFSYQVNNMVGKPFEYAFDPVTGFLRKREPVATRDLEGGKRLYEYKYFRKELKGSDCNVFVEVNIESQIVERAYTTGDGCWRPY